MIVNICGIPHRVIEKEDSFDADIHFGIIDYPKAEITINAALPDVLKRKHYATK